MEKVALKKAHKHMNLTYLALKVKLSRGVVFEREIGVPSKSLPTPTTRLWVGVLVWVKVFFRDKTSGVLRLSILWIICELTAIVYIVTLLVNCIVSVCFCCFLLGFLSFHFFNNKNCFFWLLILIGGGKTSHKLTNKLDYAINYFQRLHSNFQI